jgi:hypothetical protein
LRSGQTLLRDHERAKVVYGLGFAMLQQLADNVKIVEIIQDSFIAGEADSLKNDPILSEDPAVCDASV